MSLASLAQAFYAWEMACNRKERILLLDLAQCRVETPTGTELLALYRMLGDVFPTDRPLFAQLLRSGQPMYTWTPCTLYHGKEILGNVSWMRLRVWIGAQPVEVAGIASVATAPQYRRGGVARHLLRHCLALIDRQHLPAVLFTAQPEVYVGAGFATVAQHYAECRLPDEPWPSRGLERMWLDRLAPDDCSSMALLYARSLPNDDGKVVRDADYWPLYAMLFNVNPCWRIAACRDRGRWLGYARCEQEAERVLISEFCCAPDREDAVKALVGAVAEHARRLGRTVLSLALPPGHFLGGLLERHGVELAAEGPNAAREVFMVRPAAGQSLGPLAQLQWSLADKF